MVPLRIFFVKLLFQISRFSSRLNWNQMNFAFNSVCRNGILLPSLHPDWLYRLCDQSDRWCTSICVNFCDSESFWSTIGALNYSEAVVALKFTFHLRDTKDWEWGNNTINPGYRLFSTDFSKWNHSILDLLIKLKEKSIFYDHTVFCSFFVLIWILH